MSLHMSSRVQRNQTQIMASWKNKGVAHACIDHIEVIEWYRIFLKHYLLMMICGMGIESGLRDKGRDIHIVSVCNCVISVCAHIQYV